MKFAELGNSSLLAQFREFYQYLTRLEVMVRANAWEQTSSAQTRPAIAVGAGVTSGGLVIPKITAGLPPANRGAEGNPNSHRLGSAVRQRLLLLFEHQARDAHTYGSEFYREAQYVMAALADEVFLQIDWDGKHYWLGNLMESHLFGTHVAGEMFFQRLDRILQDRDPALKDLAAVYFMALSLGFRGRYRGFNDNGLISLYRQQLYSFIFQRTPDLTSDSKQLFPEAYQHTQVSPAPRRLADTRFWVGVLFIVIVLFIGISHMLWTNLTTPIEKANSEIMETTKGLNPK
jgi:type VI secretion system protein ImpK